MKRVLVGMSGGVDSAVAALLLQKEGYEVCGMTLQTRKADKEEETGCREADDAKKVARELGIFHFTVDCSGDFSQKVVAPFVCSYLDGQTPNPCIMCNPLVKWAEMIRAAKSVRADYVATGHYARIVRLENGRFTLQQAQHTAKDQTYMLYRLTQGQLARTLMPLADYTKDQIRKIALDAGLPVAQKPDSQEICFVTDGHYADFIEEYARTKNAAAPSEKKLLVPGAGYFVDEEGKRLGTHKGITHYTVGQRKGLGIALGHPVYVKKNQCGKE